jgi:ankyrin repeat protein
MEKLLQSCERNDFESFENLIKECTNLNYTDKDKKTCLHHAVMNENIKMVEILLLNKAFHSPEDKLHSTPLHLAASKNLNEIAIILLGNGANINIK